MIKGEDKTVEVTINDDNGSARNLNDFSEILVYIYPRRGGIIQQYSKTSKTGYEDLRVTDAANGKLEVDINSDDTVDQETDLLEAEVWTKETAADFDDSTMHLADTGVTVERLEAGQKKGKDL